MPCRHACAVEEPQLDQLIEACGALTKASSAVNSLANWWSSVRLMLEGLSDTSERVGNTNILAKLATGNTKVYFSAVNTIIAPDLENMYGVSHTPYKQHNNFDCVCCCRCLAQTVGKHRLMLRA